MTNFKKPNRMKKLWDNFLSVKRSVNFLLMTAIILIVFVDFIADSWRPFFPKAHEIGRIVVELSIAYVVSYIFYFLVIHLKEIEDKRNIYEYCAPRTRRVFYNAKSIIAVMGDKASIKIKGDYPTKGELDAILRKINPNDFQLTNSTKQPRTNIIVYLESQKEDTLKAIEAILSKMFFLETEHVKLLTRISNCNYFSILEKNLNLEKYPDNDLTFLGQYMMEYIQDVIILNTYFDKHLDKYNIRYRIEGQTG
jgi:hypothetical protein